ncbi:hypothetical protein GQ53DRAFT_829367 [Thozetella sp. PMI_491]|nr:hypothetical protein GQ53DRAFT_829367 [Thozetella sp. PMI_491]
MPRYRHVYKNLEPLTTVFSGPTTCFSTTSYIGDGIGGFFVAAFWKDELECYPSGTRFIDLHTMGNYYSPSICPSGGYTPRPYGYHTFWRWTSDCEFVVKPGETISNVWVTSDPAGSLITIQTTTTLYVNVDGLRIMWQSTDKAAVDWWETASLAVSTPSVSTGGENSPSTNLAPPPADTDSPAGIDSSVNTDSPVSIGLLVGAGWSSGSENGGGLSVGAQAGIGVSVGIAAIAIVAAIYLFLRLRKTKLRSLQPQPVQPAPTMHQMPYDQNAAWAT